MTDDFSCLLTFLAGIARGVAALLVSGVIDSAANL